MTVKLRFNPTFDISEQNLDIDRYQVRKTKRTSAELKQLKSMIELQGQVEPIQVSCEDGKYYLMSGAGRVLCLRELQRTAKALIYEGLTRDDIMKISVGTNEGRLEMSPWDRIVSVGLYHDEHPDTDIYSTKCEKSLANIFGRGRNQISEEIELWDFYKNIKPLFDLFNDTRVPMFVIKAVMDVLSPYVDSVTSYDTVADIIRKHMSNGNLNMRTFTTLFAQDMTNFIIDVKKNSSKQKTNVVKQDDNDIKTETENAEKEIHDVIKKANTVVLKNTKVDKKSKDYKNAITESKYIKMFDMADKTANRLLLMISRIKQDKANPNRELPQDRLMKLSRIINKITQEALSII